MNSLIAVFRRLPSALRYVIVWAAVCLPLTLLRGQLPAGLFPAAVIGVSAFLAISWLIHELFRMRDRRQGAQLDQELTRQTTAPSRLEMAEREREFRQKWREGVDKLARSRISLYELPWYVIIGEPGGGKTMTLLNSGMDFPLGKDELAGFGGTRNYNWWFTNSAVILDTAGRLVFEQEGTTDRHEWEAFLRLLKKRRRCPINGVIVALPADRLMSDTPEQRHHSATIIRDRLRQIQSTLDVRFPVYLLITKADRIAGFTEFFNHLDSLQRNQLFGWSRPGDFDAPFDPREFDQDFEQLYGQVHELRCRFLSRQASAIEAGWIYTFPEALRCLKQPVRDYVDVLFSRNIFAESLFFRGFYLTSALQEGRPILEILGAGLSEEHLENLERLFPQSRAFFIHDFYVEKVAKEQGLVFRSQKHIQRMRLLKNSTFYVGLPLIALCTLLMIWGWRSYDRLASEPREAAAQAAKLAQRYAAARQAGGNWTVSETQEQNDVLRAGELAGRLDAAIETLERKRGLAGLMLGSLDAEARQQIRAIKRELVGYCVLRPEVARVEAVLADAATPLSSTTESDFAASLATYLRWHFRPPLRGGLKDLDDLRRVLPSRDYAFPDQRRLLEDFCADGRLSAGLGDSRQHQRTVIEQAVTKAGSYWRQSTDIAQHSEFAWWSQLTALCVDVKQRYAQLCRLQGELETARQPRSFETAVRTWLRTFPQTDSERDEKPTNTLLLKPLRDHLRRAQSADGRLVLPEDIALALQARQEGFWKNCLAAIPDDSPGEDGEFAARLRDQIDGIQKGFRDPLRDNLEEFEVQLENLRGVLEPRPPDKPRQLEWAKSAEEVEQILDTLASDLGDALTPTPPYVRNWIGVVTQLLEEKPVSLTIDVDRDWQPAELRQLAATAVEARRRYRAQAAVETISNLLDPLPPQGLARFMEGEDDPATALQFEDLRNRHAASFLLNTIRLESSLRDLLVKSVNQGLLLDATAVSRSLSAATAQYVQHYMETWARAYASYRLQSGDPPRDWDGYRRWLRDHARVIEKEYGDHMQVLAQNVVQVAHTTSQPPDIQEELRRHLQAVIWPVENPLRPFMEKCVAAGAAPNLERVGAELKSFTARAADYQPGSLDDFSQRAPAFPDLTTCDQNGTLSGERLTRQLQYVVDLGRWLLWSEVCRRFFEDHLQPLAANRPFVFDGGAFEGVDALRLNACLRVASEMNRFRGLQDAALSPSAATAPERTHLPADWVSAAAQWHDFLARPDYSLELSYNQESDGPAGFADYYSTLALRLPGLLSPAGEVRPEQLFSAASPAIVACRWRPQKGRTELTLRDMTAAARSRNAELEPRLISMLGGPESEFGLLELIRRHGSPGAVGTAATNLQPGQPEWLIEVSKNLREIQGLDHEQTDQPVRTIRLRVRFVDPPSGIPALLAWPDLAALVGSSPTPPQ